VLLETTHNFQTSLEAQLEPELVVQRSISNCINHNEQILIKPSDVDPEEVLVLNLSDMRGLTPNLCEQIAKLYPNIHTLNLSNTGINDDHLTALSNLEMLTQLTVSHTQIRGLAFAHFTTLKIVDCSDCAALVDEAINNLEKCSLAELNLGCTSITGIHFDKLDSNISKLSLFNCKNVTDESLKKLEETLIEELTVAQTNIQGLHLHLLDSLKRLDVSGCAHLTFEAIRLLKNIPPLELLLIPANFWQRPGGQAARERICQEFAVVNKGNLVNALLE
jgi:Leucine-rich repeat (LRR) protein